MRVAYVLPSWPEPPHKGYQRIALERIRRLGTKHQVHVFCFTTPGERDAAVSDLRNSCSAVHKVHLSFFRSVLSAIFAFALGEPAQIGYYRSARMRAIIKSECARQPYDVIVVQLVRLAQFLPENFSGLALLDMIDPLPISYRRSLEWRPWYSRWFFRREADRLARYEQRIVRRFSAALLVSQDEISEYKSLLQFQDIVSIPHAVDTEFFSPATGPRTRGMIVLTGNLGYAPNVDAVNYFCSEVFPAVLASFPDATLWLVGTRPSAAVRRWEDGRRIFVTGTVPDIRPYLGRAMVAVCPVRHRIGTQTKILEAMSAGTPVVASAAAISGLITGEELPIKVAKTSAEFASHVVDLLRGNHWDELSAAGRNYVERSFSWDSSLGRFESLLTSVLTERGKAELTRKSNASTQT
jgi:polysaccharide biosynthesis protein PslH